MNAQETDANEIIEVDRGKSNCKGDVRLRVVDLAGPTGRKIPWIETTCTSCPLEWYAKKT